MGTESTASVGSPAVLDPRSRYGRRHPLPDVLALATVAMLCGARSLCAIAQWGREQPEAVVRQLGFTRQSTPGVATLHRVFKRVDVEQFETVLAQRAQAALSGRGRRSRLMAKRCAASTASNCPASV